MSEVATFSPLSCSACNADLDTIAARDWDKLVRHDQLTKQKRLGRVSDSN